MSENWESHSKKALYSVRQKLRIHIHYFCRLHIYIYIFVSSRINLDLSPLFSQWNYMKHSWRKGRRFIFIIKRWSFVRNTRSTCKAKRKSYLGLASRTSRRSWRSAGVIYSVTMALMGSLATKHVLTIAQVIWKKRKTFLHIFVLIFYTTVNIIGLIFWVLVLFPNLDRSFG